MKILLIDDEPRQANLMGRMLQRLGHDPTIAMHHNDALALVRGDIDAVVTDIDMPGMNGVALAEQIRLRVVDIPIAFTATESVKTSVLVAAAQIGPVLPELWTLTDLKELLRGLAPDRRSLFQTTDAGAEEGTDQSYSRKRFKT